jgi:hypothetical protein
MKGRSRREAWLATGGGKPLKVKSHERYRHETRPEGLQVEQGVKRLRKPEGAAQPDEASPVWVAACFLKRWRDEEPHGRVAHEARCRVCFTRGAGGSGQATGGHTLYARLTAREFGRDAPVFRSGVAQRRPRDDGFCNGIQACGGGVQPIRR